MSQSDERNFAEAGKDQWVGGYQKFFGRACMTAITTPLHWTGHGRAARRTQHRDHLILLRGAFCAGLRLRVRQGLNRRPQLIDQRIAVADLLSLFDAGETGRSSGRTPMIAKRPA
jgi:hypothetical protein